MVALPSRHHLQNTEMRSWQGEFAVLVFLFAHPDSDAITMLNKRGEYLDIRTGESWDLFFPGYYKSPNRGLEDQVGATPVGDTFARDWYFSAREFDNLRDFIERQPCSDLHRRYPWWHHPTSVAEPPLPSGVRHAHKFRGLPNPITYPNTLPEPPPNLVRNTLTTPHSNTQ